MRVATLLGLAIVSCGSGESKCQQFCDKIRDTLIVDFGVPPSEVNCSDAMWDTNDCQQCDEILLANFGVQVTTGTNACESGGTGGPDGAADGATHDGGEACTPAAPPGTAFVRPGGVVIDFGSSCSGTVYYVDGCGFAFCDGGVWNYTVTDPSARGYHLGK